MLKKISFSSLAMSDIVWQKPRGQPTLKPGEIHVWQASLEATPEEVQKMRSLLSPDECERADRFRFEEHRSRFILGRGILRLLLSQYSTIAAHQIRFDYQARGKPLLANRSDIQFNLAHSENLAIYAFGLDRGSIALSIGIDVEFFRPLTEAMNLARRFFTPEEATYLANLTPQRQTEAFFRIWTCKEAYLKATGEGISGLQTIQVNPEEFSQVVAIAGDALGVTRWLLYSLRWSDRCIAALAVPAGSWKLCYWQWET